MSCTASLPNGKDISFDCCEGCPIQHCDYYATLVRQLEEQEKLSSPSILASVSSESTSEDLIEECTSVESTIFISTNNAAQIVFQQQSFSSSSTSTPRSAATTSSSFSLSLPTPAKHCPVESLACFFASIAPSLTLTSLSCALDKVFSMYPNSETQWPLRKQAIELLLQRVNISGQELDQFAHFSSCLPYTRNLIATDAMHYTILLLCWPAGKESKIHNHPCDGCFVKSVRGQIKETKYVEEDKCDASTIEGNASSRCMRVISEVVLSPGEVTYMDDFIGYHKVGNAETDETQDCAITLHVYTPPYQSCKVKIEFLLRL